jgi:hypothetical protein
MTYDALKKMYQLLLTEPHAPTVCAQLERIAREALAEHAMREVQRLGQEIEQEPVAHWSDCAVHSEPAYPKSECDCGGIVAVADYTALSDKYVALSDKYVALSDKYVALKAQRTEQTSAERTLQHLGYTDCGGEYWKPPLGNPPQRKPLTEEQIVAKALHLSGLGTNLDVLQFARAIEAAHGIKGNA